MVQVFRKNWFVFTLLLFPYTIITRIWSFFEVPNWPYNTEDQSFVYQYLEQYFPETYYWNVIAASFLVFINAAQINNIIIRNRIARDINLFPGMVFILLTALHPDMFWLSPQLIAVTFLLGAISNIFRIYQKPSAAVYIFNAGLLTGLASIFSFSYSLFIFFAVISILVLRKFDIRDFLQLITGFFLAFFFLAFIRFWNDADFNIFGLLIEKLKIIFPFRRFQLNEWIIFVINALLIFTFISNYRKFTIKKSIQSQKKVNLFYWFLIIGFITLPFTTIDFLFPSFIVIYVSFAVFIGMIMTRIKNDAALELLHLFLLFFIIFSHFSF